MKIFDATDKKLMQKLLDATGKGQQAVVYESKPADILSKGVGTVHQFWTVNRGMAYQCELGIFLNDLRIRDLKITDLHEFVKQTIDAINTLVIEPTEHKSVFDQFFDTTFVIPGYPFAIEVRRTGDTFAEEWKEVTATLMNLAVGHIHHGIVDIDPKKKIKEGKGERTSQPR